MYALKRDSILTLALLCLGLVIVALIGSGCSTDSATVSPVAGNEDPLESKVIDPCDLGPEYCYPPITAELLAAGPAPGYQFLRPKNERSGSLDDDPESVTRTRRIRNGHGGHVGINQNRVDIPAGALPRSRMLISVTYYPDMPGIVDFGPHPTFFEQPVQIRINLDGLEIPEGSELEDLAIFYLTDDGEYVLYEGTIDPNGRWLRAETDHFSRYIIAARLNF